MRYLPFMFLLALAACDSHSFERDKRQILAKDEIRKQLRGFRDYNITNFKEDTLQTWSDSVIIHPIRYTLHLTYTDSLGNSRSKEAAVIFTPEGNAVLRSEIKDAPLTSE